MLINVGALDQAVISSKSTNGGDHAYGDHDQCGTSCHCRIVNLGASVISSTAQTSRAATSDRVALSCRRLAVSGWRVGFLHPHDQLRVIVWRSIANSSTGVACLSRC